MEDKSLTGSLSSFVAISDVDAPSCSSYVAVNNVDDPDENARYYRVKLHPTYFGDPDNLWFCQYKNSPCMAKFNEEIINHYNVNKQTDDEFNRKMAFCEELKAMIGRYSEAGDLHWVFGVYATGSSVTGLAGQNSDVDICINFPQAHVEDGTREQRDVSTELLQIVRHMIVREISSGVQVNVKYMELVTAAIPLLRIVTMDNIEADISACTDRFVSGVHNSFLIRGYTVYDPRFAPLCMFVKDWAARTGVKNPHPSVKHFNSYALVMLVVHYLQSGVNPPVIPNLQKLYQDEGCYAQTGAIFPNEVNFGDPLPNIPNWDRSSMPMNDSTVAELFIGFLQYYKVFEFSKYRICMKNSCVLERRRNTCGRQKEYVVDIEDPIDHHNPGRTVNDLDGCLKIFEKTLQLLGSALDDGKSDDFPSIDNIFNVK